MPHLLPLSLRNRQPGRIRPQLDGLEQALGQLGHPERGARSILVVGTNGKGSTVALLDSVLRAHGLATGRFTSPHLVRVEERIVIRGEPIDAVRLAALADRLAPFPELTFFETLAAVAYLAFAEATLDCWLLEAGMGGSWDATRLASSAIAGLTNVGTDHREWLGPDRPSIARDKGAALAAAVLGVVGRAVEPSLWPALGAPAARPAGDLASCRPIAENLVELAWDRQRTSARLPLVGAHQLANLELALALARAAESLGWLELEPAAVRRGVESTSWPGRLSRHRIGGRELTLDGAHNLEGVTALADHLRIAGTRPSLLFSCLADKPLEEMAALLRPLVAAVAVCPLDDPRAMPLARLVGAFPGCRSAPSPLAGLEALPDPVLAAGSLRLVGALLEHAQEH